MPAERVAALPPAGTDQGAHTPGEGPALGMRHMSPRRPRVASGLVCGTVGCAGWRALPWPRQNTQLVVHMKSP